MTEEKIQLKEYFEALRNEDKESVKTALASLDKRLDGMNEFRDTLKDQAGRFITREEITLIVGRIESDIKNLQLAKAVLEGKASQQSVTISLIISVLSILIGIFSLITKFL